MPLDGPRDHGKRPRNEEGLDQADIVRSKSTTPTFQEVLQRRISRRGVLKAGAAAGMAGALAVTGPVIRIGAGGGSTAAVSGVSAQQLIAFQPIAPQPADAQQVQVAAGHAWSFLMKWGDPIHHGAPAFDPLALTREAQEQQFGYNADFLGWIPIATGTTGLRHGLFWANHEYTDGHIMWHDYVDGQPTREQADVEMAAHGGSVLELRGEGDGPLVVDLHSPLNRRITATTPMRISGPAAGHEWMKTSDDPFGTLVHGTLNNCAGGVTPWGTFLTGEENFQGYFGNLANLPQDDPRWELHDRYGIAEEGSFYGWEQYYGRFDVVAEPNEPFRFGWVVEVDPWNPASTPIKHTALGRMRHEGAEFALAPSGQVVLYMGDDERFEYAYKYVSAEAWDPLKRGMGQSLLENGTLYVARYDDDGSGEWLPLVYGENGLDESNGFSSQGDVLIKTRLAADVLGATRMDRPEDMQQNPVTKRVYLALTNNTQRTADDTDPSNPRPSNSWGHVIEMTEAGDDPTATSFSWEIFLLCGDPNDESTYFAGFPKDMVSPIANPDNLTFDADGNLWIATDGQPGTLELADGLFAVPTTGPQRGYVAQFLSVVAGAETCGPQFTDDFRTLFVAVQHPGEDGTLDEPQTLWPDGGPLPRPAVIQVWNTSGGRVGDA